MSLSRHPDIHLNLGNESILPDRTPPEGGIIERIYRRAIPSLEHLKGEIKGGSPGGRLLAEARRRETHFFSVLEDFGYREGTLSYRLDMASKRNLGPVIDDIVWLYRQSEGEERGKNLEEILKSPNDEPYDLDIEYQIDKRTGKYRILSMVCILTVLQPQTEVELV